MKRTKRRAAADDQTREATRLDRWLTGGLMVVAAAAAGLPWYVFLNPEKFGITGKGWEALMNVPQRGGGGVDAVIPHVDDALAADGRKQQTVPPIDNLTTATVPANGEGAHNAEEANVQPLPGGSRFKLLHVSNGRALIEDKSGMFLVKIGSVLPDESRLLSLTNVDGKWQIVTSLGEVYSE